MWAKSSREPPELGKRRASKRQQGGLLWCLRQLHRRAAGGIERQQTRAGCCEKSAQVCALLATTVGGQRQPVRQVRSSSVAEALGARDPAALARPRCFCGQSARGCSAQSSCQSNYAMHSLRQIDGRGSKHVHLLESCGRMRKCSNDCVQRCVRGSCADYLPGRLCSRLLGLFFRSAEQAGAVFWRVKGKQGPPVARLGVRSLGGLPKSERLPPGPPVT